MPQSTLWMTVLRLFKLWQRSLVWAKFRCTWQTGRCVKPTASRSHGLHCLRTTGVVLSLQAAQQMSTKAASIGQPAGSVP